ncbi:hypothetical protein D3C87_2006520 [compost metagenome]
MHGVPRDRRLDIRIQPNVAAWIEIATRVKANEVMQLMQNGLDELGPVEVKASHLLQARNGLLLNSGEGHEVVCLFAASLQRNARAPT